MLVYHPAFDAYHCVFRLLAILEIESSIEVDALRVLDFTLCFPSVVSEFRLSPQSAAIRRAAKESANTYRSPINPKAMFVNLKSAHDGALSCLAAAGFVSNAELKRGRAVRTALSLPTTLTNRCKQLKESEPLFFGSLMRVLLDMPLHGENGLKARSGLMEYRYDHV